MYSHSSSRLQQRAFANHVTRKGTDRQHHIKNSKKLFHLSNNGLKNDKNRNNANDSCTIPLFSTSILRSVSHPCVPALSHSSKSVVKWPAEYLLFEMFSRSCLRKHKQSQHQNKVVTIDCCEQSKTFRERKKVYVSFFLRNAQKQTCQHFTSIKNWKIPD